MMKIILVPGAPFDNSFYLQEILGMYGPPCVLRLPLADALREANPGGDLLILSQDSQSDGIEDYLQAGGSVVAIRPQKSIAALAGLKQVTERQAAGRLRVVAPICAGARGEPLWTLGPQVVYESELPVEEQAAGTLAYLFERGDFQSESPGIFQCAVGEGVLTVFAYDPALCISQLRQGLPQRAGVLPPGEVVPRSTYLHDPDSPSDTAWRPTADLHAVALCDVVGNLLARRAPVPTLWHIPAGKRAILLFSGDEDGAAQEMNEDEMTDVESFGATMGLYVIPNETSITRRHIDEYCRRGHEISVHPDLWPTSGKSVEAQLAKAEADVLMFREQFGQPVHTVRNHSGIWPGYLDLPELWERLGIGMDSSCLASLLYQSPDHGPYAHINAAMPLRFVRPDGSLIDVYEQPPHISDDYSYHPTLDYSQKISVEQSDWIIERMLEDAARWFYAPFCPIIHPSNYVLFSREQGKSYLRHACALDLPIWPLDRWHNFWRARASWHMSTLSWSGSRLRFSLTGSPGEQLYITLPAAYQGMALSSLSLNESASGFETVERFKRSLAQVALPADVSAVEVAAEYA